MNNNELVALNMLVKRGYKRNKIIHTILILKKKTKNITSFLSLQIYLVITHRRAGKPTTLVVG